MSTSFIKSTIDLRQSSFSGFFDAKPSRIAVTSTTSAGAKAPAGGVAAATGGIEPLVGGGCAPGAAVDSGLGVPFPRIFPNKLASKPIAFTNKKKGIEQT